MNQQPLFNDAPQNHKDFKIVQLIAKIKDDLNRLESLFVMPEIVEKKPEPIHWDKGLRDNTKSLVLTLVKKYGNNKIQRNSNYLKNLIWDYRVTDLAQLLKTLEERNFCKIEYIAGSNRIEHFSFIKQ